MDQANQLFKNLDISEGTGNLSQTEMAFNQKSNMGLMMFIVGFLGLTFLITSGCILYFKQMDEGEEEKPNYTILRKLGFTQGNLLKGIQIADCSTSAFRWSSGCPTVTSPLSPAGSSSERSCGAHGHGYAAVYGAVFHIRVVIGYVL